MRKIVLILTLGGVVFATSFSFALAYNPEKTHYPLAKSAVELYNLFYPDNPLTEQEKQWIAQGAADEDNPSLRVMHHFFDPINKKGVLGFSASPDWARDPGLQGLDRYQYGFPESNQGIFTWEEGLKAYARGDKEKAYKTLGHMFHLLQDAAVPAHTRQDPHPPKIGWGPLNFEAYGGKDPYEYAAENMPAPSLAGLRPKEFSSLEQYFSGIAEYTNTHFLSKDSVGYYAKPDIARMDMQYIYASDNGSELRLAKIERELASNLFIGDPEFTTDSFSDPLVIRDYWYRLAPKAIEHTAGLINFFHKSAEFYEPEPTDGSEESAGFLGAVKNYFTDMGNSLRGWGEFGRWGLTAAAQKLPDPTTLTLDPTITIQPSLSPPFVTPSLDLNPSFKSLGEVEKDKARERFAAQVTEAADDLSERFTEFLAEDADSPAENTNQDEPEDVGDPIPYIAAKVIDGDTIELEDGRRVRYIGIDTPELPRDGKSGGCFAEEAAGTNSTLVLNRQVVLKKPAEGEAGIDDYGRLLRYVYVGDIFVNQYLVEKGYAYAYDFGANSRFTDIFEQEENQARENRLGLWGDACHPAQDADSSEQEQTAADESLDSAQSKQEEDVGSETSYILNKDILINEVRIEGEEFIELYNPTDSEAPLAGYYFAYYPLGRTDWADPWRVKQFPAEAVLTVRGYFDWRPYSSNTLSNESGTIALWAGDPREQGAERIDAFGWGKAVLAESAALPYHPSAPASAARADPAQDTDFNMQDFALTSVITPGFPNVIVSASAGSSAAPEPSEEQQGEEQEEDNNQNNQGPQNNVVINEIAWMGTGNSYADEWIELYNLNSSAVSLEGWRIEAQDGTPSIQLQGSIEASSYFLLERTDDTSVPGVTMDMSYTGALGNSGEKLVLFNSAGDSVDVIDFSGGWPAGDNSTKQTMERISASQDGSLVSNWGTSDPVGGTPKAENSVTGGNNNQEGNNTGGPPVWASWQNDAQNSGIATTTGPLAAPAFLWQDDLGGQAGRTLQPVIDGESNIYVAKGNKIYSFTSSGDERWISSGVPGGDIESIALSPDSQYLFSVSSKLSLLNTSDGSIENTSSGSFQSGSGGPTPVVVDPASGIAAIVTTNKVYAFSADGTKRWEKKWKDLIPVSSGAAVQNAFFYEGSLYVMGEAWKSDWTIIAFEPDTGSQVWSRDLNEGLVWDIIGDPVVSKDGLMYTTYDGPGSNCGIAAYDLESENSNMLLWAHQVYCNGGRGFSLTLGPSGAIYFREPVSKDIYSIIVDEGVRLHPKIYDSSGEKTRLPVTDAAGSIYIATKQGILYVLEPSDYEELWSYTLAGENIGAVALGAERVVLTLGGGKLYILEEE